MVLSDSNFLIDANYDSTGALDPTSGFNGVTITTALNTGATIGGNPVNATLEWQAASASNSSLVDPLTGEMAFTLEFKINFTGSWLGTQTCRTGAFKVIMDTSGYTMPYTLLTGTAYTFAHGYFEANSAGFNVPDVSHTQCATSYPILESLLSIGGTSNAAAMDIYFGFPTYNMSGGKVSGT